MSRITVINATNGQALLDAATEGEFDRWYDGHSDYRKPRDISEVHPDFRDQYAANHLEFEWLVRD